MKQLHDGHRERLRRKFLSEAKLENHELLELLLFYSIPRRNTNEIAHRLLRQFGSLRRILGADMHQLMRIEGVGVRTALLLKVVAALGAATFAEQQKPPRRISSEEELRRYLIGLLRPSAKEEVYLLLLDGGGRLIHTELLATGLASSSQFSVQKAVQLACQHRASAAVLAHNHPDGLPLPSDQDVKTTQRFQRALRLANVQLINHYVICDNDCLAIPLDAIDKEKSHGDSSRS